MHLSLVSTTCFTESLIANEKSNLTWYFHFDSENHKDHSKPKVPTGEALQDHRNTSADANLPIAHEFSIHKLAQML